MPTNYNNMTLPELQSELNSTSDEGEQAVILDHVNYRIALDVYGSDIKFKAANGVGSNPPGNPPPPPGA